MLAVEVAKGSIWGLHLFKKIHLGVEHSKYLMISVANWGLSQNKYSRFLN